MFLVDPEGRIVAMEKADFPVGRSMVEQLRVVAAAMGMDDDIGSSNSCASSLCLSSDTKSSTGSTMSDASKASTKEQENTKAKEPDAVDKVSETKSTNSFKSKKN